MSADAAPKDDVSRRLIASVLQFLESEIQREDLDDEIKQSVDVSRQCLQSAYTMTSADVPTEQKTLKDIFLAACPAPVSRCPYLFFDVWKNAYFFSTA